MPCERLAEHNYGMSDARPEEHEVPTEPRWLILLAVLASIALQFTLPNRHVLSPTFLFPAVELLLLVALVVGDPGRDDRGPAGYAGSSWPLSPS